jgi:hypothetical protein
VRYQLDRDANVTVEIPAAIGQVALTAVDASAWETS